jgi:hypothetical protein
LFTLFLFTLEDDAVGRAIPVDYRYDGRERRERLRMTKGGCCWTNAAF